MSKRTLIILGVVALVVVVVGIIAATALFTPASEPQFQAALAFAQAIGEGDNVGAARLLHPLTQEWIAQNCPGGGIASCLNVLIPDEWGDFMSVVFRRATPDGQWWDVDLIATYEQGVGFSGICIYLRMEELAEGDWRVITWAGWVHCGDERSRNMANNPDAPNRGP